MKATKFFGMALFAFRQFSKTEDLEILLDFLTLDTFGNQRFIRPQRLIDYYPYIPA